MKKLIKLWAKVFLAATIICSFVIVSYATSIDEEREKKEELENELNETKEFISTLEDLKENEEEYIYAMDVKLGEIAGNIYNLTLQAEDVQTKIDKKQKQIKKTQKNIDEQYADMKLRIQYMYENGEASDMAMLFDSDNMSQMLEQAEYINKITEYDREMLLKLKETKKKLQAQQKELKAQKKELNGLLADAENKRASTELLITEKQQEVAAYEGQINQAEVDAATIQKHIEEQEKLIKEMEEIERRRKEQEQQVIYDGGQMLWPLPGYYTLSDDYGMRPDPFGGYGTSMHNGIDIPAPAGTPIIAAYDGEIAWAGWNWSAGNWIGIDHGDGIYTVYMHMSQMIITTEGTKVKAGDTIGLVGTTGSSTGNHLHFAVRLDGAYVDPKTYVMP